MFNLSSAPRLLDALTMRALLVGALALSMLVPLSFVATIVQERADRHASVLDDIARTWGGPQTVTGPILVVPFTEVDTVEENIVEPSGAQRTVRRTVRRQRTARFLPAELSLAVTLSDQVRERGLFSALVYDADVQLAARFAPVSVESLSDSLDSVQWEDAWVSIGLSDTRAITEVSRFDWNGTEATLSPGSKLQELGAGFHATVADVTADRPFTLDMALAAKGSGEFRFTPLGQTTTVAMSSSWPHPSFQGDALPDSRTLGAEGFRASWEIPHLARNYPQAWRSDDAQDLGEFTAGVSLYETVSLYSQVTRSVKYGLLFVGLTFLTMLGFEVALKRSLHPVQYALVGIALSVFFLVLLALSEHVGFLRAYAAGATLSVSMIALYTGTVLRSVFRGLAILGLLAGLYAVLLSLLRLEELALLMGTALVVLVVAALMAATRNLHERPA